MRAVPVPTMHMHVMKFQYCLTKFFQTTLLGLIFRNFWTVIFSIQPGKKISKAGERLNAELESDEELFESDPKDENNKNRLLEKVDEFHSYCLYHCFLERIGSIVLLFFAIWIEQKSRFGFLVKLDALFLNFVFLSVYIDEFVHSALHYRSTPFMPRGGEGIFLMTLHYTYYQIFKFSFRWVIQTFL